MMNVFESTFILKIGAHREGLYDWRGHCAQLSSPPVWTCFAWKFSAIKSYLSTSHMQLCSSEMWLKSFLSEYYASSLPLTGQKFMGIILTPKTHFFNVQSLSPAELHYITLMVKPHGNSCAEN